MKTKHMPECHSWNTQETFQEVMAEQLKKAPWMGVSVAIHAVMIFLLWNVEWQSQVESKEGVIQVEAKLVDRVNVEEDKEVEEEPKWDEPVDLPETNEDIEETFTEDIIDDVLPSPEANETPFDHNAFNDIIGIGGGAGGPGGGGKTGGRRGPKRPHLQKRVTKALDWLAKHQDEDGKWDADGFDSHCDCGKCSGPGQPVTDIGVTGLALLAFLGDGHTLRYGKYRQNLKRGIKWLKDQQDDEGLFGERAGQSYMYSHMIASIAMTEAFGLSRYRTLKKSAQKAINYISSSRNAYKAWRYQPRDGDNDSSVTGWAVIALASAESFKSLDIKVSPADFKGAINWFDEMTDPNTGRIGYLSRGSAPARPQELIDSFPASKSEAITAVGLMARFFAHQDPKKNPIMFQHADLIARKPPVWNEKDGSIDMYYWYYGTYAMYQMGGRYWKDWSRKMEKAVVGSQCKEGCADGSWDPVGTWGNEGGRVYSTALMAMCLEAYYRYSRIVVGR